MKELTRLDRVFAEIRELENDIQKIMDSVREADFEMKVEEIICKTEARFRPVGWHLNKGPKVVRKPVPTKPIKTK